MFHWFYCLPLSYVIMTTILFIMLWGVGYYKVSKRNYGIKQSTLKYWKITNFILFVLSFVVILFLTIFSRERYVNLLELRPFFSFEIAKNQPEMYRSLIMNIILFVPFGVFLASSLSSNLSDGFKIIITILCGSVLSFLIEFLQYYYSLGEAWTDDVICNVIGAFCGSLTVIVWKLFFLFKHNYT